MEHCHLGCSVCHLWRLCILMITNSLQSLDLSYNKLQGSIPRSISRLVNLTVLHLSSNNLSIMLGFEMFSREFLNSIDNLKSLKHLALPNCNFTGSIPAWLGNFTKLTYLDLSYNSFNGEILLALLNFRSFWLTYQTNNFLIIGEYF